MGGVMLFCAFTACGLPIGMRLLPHAGRGTRVWLGMVIGQGMMLWLPSLFAFFLRFSLAAQLCALGAALAAGAAAALIPGKASHELTPERVGRGEEPPLWLAGTLVALLGLAMAWLLAGHVLTEENGYLFSGQATNGDMNLHLAIASCLANGGAFPPEYPIYAGVRLGYNFLSDALSASMMTAGSSIRTAFILPGVVHTMLAGWGFVMLAWEATRSKRACALAFALLFLNGGLGFCYVLDQVVQDPSRWWEALYGFYRAPANMTDHNIRWSNLLCDMLLPQRALAPGWMLFTACLWLLQRAIATGDRRKFILLGVLAGLLPMVHAHSFFALAIISFGALIYCAAKKRGQTRAFLLYACVTAVLALPQAIFWILPQAASEGSMRLQFDWVNNVSGRLIDDWLWFWVKNVGPVFLVFVPAYFISPRRYRPLLIGAGLVFVAADLVVFQKNVYDNNKIFYAAFLAALPAASAYLVNVYDRMKGLPGRRLLAGAFLVVCLLSGSMTFAREVISGGEYILFIPEEVTAMDWIRSNTDRDALILTGDEYNNPVCALAGRGIYCGSGSFLYYHSIDYDDRLQAQSAMLAHPRENLTAILESGIDYIYIGRYERNDCAADVDALKELFDTVYESDGIYLFRVRSIA